MPNSTTQNDDAKARRLSEVMDWSRRRLGLATLENRNSDSLDFHDIGVACLRDVIAAAFKAGYEAGLAADR